MSRLIFLGDSTLQYNDETTYPQVGWPQGFQKYLKPEVEVFNFAKNGRSTKSFIDEGLFAEAIEYVDGDSIVVIEFGHNDEHTHQPERFTQPFGQYRDNLIWMINQVRAKGGSAMLATPIYRRLFLEDGSVDTTCHEGYREAVKAVAEEMSCPLVDLCTLTYQRLIEIGKDASREYYMNFDEGIYENYPEGMSDNTHLRQKGADAIAQMFYQDTIRQQLPITDYYNH